MQDQNAGDREDVIFNLANAEKDRRLVEVGKAIHNMKFSDQLIAHAYDNLNAALIAAGSPLRLESLTPENAVPNECANCHTGSEVLTVEYEGSTFKHQVHVADNSMVCMDCHSNARSHGEVVLFGDACSSCHHGGDDLLDPGTCESCHETVANLYSGTYAGNDTPDYMFDEDVTCDECHLSDTRIVLPQPSVCVDCHDEDYADQAIEWLGQQLGIE